MVSSGRPDNDAPEVKADQQLCGRKIDVSIADDDMIFLNHLARVYLWAAWRGGFVEMNKESALDSEFLLERYWTFASTGHNNLSGYLRNVRVFCFNFGLECFTKEWKLKLILFGFVDSG